MAAAPGTSASARTASTPSSRSRRAPTTRSADPNTPTTPARTYGTSRSLFRVGIWQWGDRAAAGKSNDFKAFDCRFENPLVNAINLRGTRGDRSRPEVGSTANFTDMHNEYFAQMSGRIEEGMIEEQIDATHFKLRTTPTVGNTENLSAEAPITFTMVNNTGVTLFPDDVVRIASNLQANQSYSYLAGPTGNALTRHAVVWAPLDTTSFPTGSIVHLVAFGRNVKVNVNALATAANIGDFLVPMTSQKAAVIPSAEVIPTLSTTFDSSNYTATINALNKAMRGKDTKLGVVTVGAGIGATQVVATVGL